VFYKLLKIYARLAIRLYCKKVVVSHPAYLKTPGPVLYAANHPNSFLDGVILTTLHQEDVYSLARGDAFKNPKVNRFLRKMKLLPVYRTSEGVENLEQNYTTFASCISAFEKNKSVLIFSEGRCENEWHLRPLKKGTARLALSAWKKGIPLKVIPLGFNYSDFNSVGKEVHLLFGDILTKDMINEESAEGKKHLDFNERLHAQLSQLVYEIRPEEQQKRKKLFSIKIRPSFFFLLLPGIIGGLLHAPFYFLMKGITGWKFRNSGHYDSVLTSLLFFGYPFYIFLFCVCAWSLAGVWSLAIPFVLPLLAWCCIQVKYQLDF
jgi:1-acyl-sn-glycerol-3-phosphate acyltransferase